MKIALFEQTRHLRLFSAVKVSKFSLLRQLLSAPSSTEPLASPSMPQTVKTKMEYGMIYDFDMNDMGKFEPRYQLNLNSGSIGDVDDCSLWVALI